MRRLDHSMIFVLIAGTFTPIAMISLTADLGARWLWISWSLAGLGAVLRVVWLTAPKWLTAVLAVGLGWISLTVLPEVLDSIGWLPVLFVALGGLSYTVGAAIYSFKRPDPMPAVFGYHEIFHALVLIGAGFHYAMIAIWII
jgi:hemolysin III